ncbi:MAG: right-handed parallel beta-helix repeat-containing protein [Chloroflexi bacterium]|nr:right-handed parallel beta-helix repeat-containing protein [Chloroflexota bacterium]
MLDGKDSPRDGWCFDVQSNRAIVDGFTITRFGGGVRFSHREGTTAVVRNCVIVRNASHGIFFNHGGCAKNCTVAYNGGAGLYAYDMGGGGDDPANLILFGNEQGFVRQSANISLHNSCTDDPHFVSDKDFRLRSDSPCIDAGRNEDWMIEAVDAAGRPRIQNKVVDVGAYEFQALKLHVNKRLKEDGWIALAPLVQADRDLQDAGWKWDGHSAAFSAGKPRALVSIPVRIAGSYELQTRVTITRAKEVTAICLPITSTRAVVLGMKGDRGNSESPTATIRLTGLKHGAQPRDNVSMKIGTEYALSCKVLRTGNKVTIEIRRDGRVLFQWAGSVAQVAERRLMRPGTVQLETASYTTSRFTDLRLKMLSGEAVPLFSELIGQPEPTVDGRVFTLTTDSAKKAVDHFLAELKEIDRVAALRKAEAKARLDMSLQQLKQFETETGKRYHGMLGSYFNHQGRIPFIMLSVPNGENVLGENARGTLNAAKYDSARRLYKFETHGHVIIPRDGSYHLEVSRAAGIKLNGMTYTVGSPVAGKPPYADVELTRGVYEVSFDVGNNGGQLGYAMIRIVENKSKTELPIFFYESELKTFRNDLSLGVELLETSRWTREDNEIQ